MTAQHLDLAERFSERRVEINAIKALLAGY